MCFAMRLLLQVSQPRLAGILLEGGYAPLIVLGAWAGLIDWALDPSELGHPVNVGAWAWGVLTLMWILRRPGAMWTSRARVAQALRWAWLTVWVSLLPFLILAILF